jgi:hypothetical protein
MTKTWRDKQTARPDPIASAVAAWEYSAERDPHVRMAEAIDAYDAAEAIVRQCDEPGCQREASCGFPVEGGYRRTCYEHSKWAAL